MKPAKQKRSRPSVKLPQLQALDLLSPRKLEQISSHGKLQNATADQLEAIDLILAGSLCQSPKDLEMALTGAAGTGKSYVVEILRDCLTLIGHKLAINAPTNKAVQSLSRLGVLGAETIHKAYRIVPKDFDPQTGQQLFLPLWEDKPSEQSRAPIQQDKTFVIVDESSMIGVPLYKIMVDAVNLWPIQDEGDYRLYPKILWIGDLAQLPPIGHPKTPCFENCFVSYNLTRIVRYQGPVLEYATQLRQNLTSETLPSYTKVLSPNPEFGNIYTFSDPRKWVEQFLIALNKGIDQGDPYFVRGLHARNYQVDHFNRIIRSHLYGHQAQPYEPGERLIATEPCLDDSHDTPVTLLANSDECIVQEVEECEVAVAHPATGERIQMMVYRLQVETDEQEVFCLRCLHPQSQPKLRAILNELAETIKANLLLKPDHKAKYYSGEALDWKHFYQFKNRFHLVQPAFNLTVHKAQGSTFEHCFLNMRDIAKPFVPREANLQNRPDPEKYEIRNRATYVAWTRARKHVVILV
ncbi:MAG: AAA family ATPase [Oscillatoriales cyanobacterium RM2_1_1]|nr:AAA family ATPase [Oscillatoriales cyanobacterium SM2_3_0]NJO46685.1 AAA family ATPase [Oscillatoriales cyanobacterium RM2_1_1]